MPEYDAFVATRSDDSSTEDGDEAGRRDNFHVSRKHPRITMPVSKRSGTWRHAFETHLPNNKWSAAKDDSNSSKEREGSFAHTIKQIFGRSWLNVLLIFIPFGIAAHAAGLNNPTITFGLNALAIIPLTELLIYATENVSHGLGVGIGALLNITFGNLVELVLLVFMLREGHLRIVIASLLGSIFVNLLFILGLAIMSAGLRHKEQIYNQKVTQILVFFMTTGILSLLIPTSLHACVKKLQLADSVTLKFSRGISVTLLGVYIMFLHFQIRTHAQMSGEPQYHQPDEESIEGKVYSPMSESPSQEDLTRSIPLSPVSGVRSKPAKIIIKPEDSTEPGISKRSSLILLVVSAGLVSLCAEYLVDSIEHVISNAPLTEAFLGLIILPLLGNAAEMGTAITVAVKNKIDLAINVTVGSAIQITLFMAPAMVLLGWVTGRDLSLYFDMFQTVTLLATLMIVNIMMLSGRSNYLLGMLLCACYVVIGTGAFFLPNQKGKKAF